VGQDAILRGNGIPALLSKPYHRNMPDQVNARQTLIDAYHRFLSADDAGQQNEAGKDLIRAILGTTAIAEDSIL
jgi:hypothetical protein